MKDMSIITVSDVENIQLTGKPEVNRKLLTSGFALKKEMEKSI